MTEKGSILPTTTSLEKKESNQNSTSEHAQVPIGENINARLVNPLAGLSQEELATRGRDFAKKFELGHLDETFAKGAMIAQDPAAFEQVPGLNEEEKTILRTEVTHRWKQPRQLYYLVIACSMAAAVQGVRKRRPGLEPQ